MDLTKPQDAIHYVRSASTIRDRSQQVMQWIADGHSSHFAYHPEALKEVIDFVVTETKKNYPDLNIPYHSRWRHFDDQHACRTSVLQSLLADSSKEQLRAKFHLVIISVLLDAGAGNKWRYLDPRTAVEYKRSEGLAVASFNMFIEGFFSSSSQTAMLNFERLSTITTDELADAFQVHDDNPLLGVQGRCKLLNELGDLYQKQGDFYDYLDNKSLTNEITADDLLKHLLNYFADIWPSRIRIENQNLGDVWRHQAIKTNDLTDELIPFHKLSQWLCYSLFEPLEQANIKILNKDTLTGLPEYRNGGLFIDFGVLTLKQSAAASNSVPVDSELIIEWRAATVCLLDKVAAGVRAALKLTSEQLPLASVLQGGTWSAGRRIAKQKRSDSRPPINISSDATVF